MSRGVARGGVTTAARVLLGIASLTVATTAGAQSATLCLVTTTPVNAPPGSGQDACTKASDIFMFLAPQVGVALSGGNVMLGEGGTLGGWGKRSFVLRVSAVDGRVPENDVPLSLTALPVASDFGAQRAPVPVPSFDAAIGVFRGVPFGLTNIGGVDLLLGATVLPSVTQDDFRVQSEGGGVAINYGLRIGLLQESAAVPGVGVSIVRRRLPTTSISYFTSNDTLGVLDTKISTTSIRLTANKRFGLMGIGGGIGQDRLDSRTTLEATLNETVQGVPSRAVARLENLSHETTRGTAFVNASFGLAMAQLVLEVGQSRAGSIRETLNSFGDRRANEAYTYGSVGFGFRF
jgi:hypothetical protein